MPSCFHLFRSDPRHCSARVSRPRPPRSGGPARPQVSQRCRGWRPSVGRVARSVRRRRIAKTGFRSDPRRDHGIDFRCRGTRDTVPDTLARVGQGCRILNMVAQCGWSLRIRCEMPARGSPRRKNSTRRRPSKAQKSAKQSQICPGHKSLAHKGLTANACGFLYAERTQSG